MESSMGERHVHLGGSLKMKKKHPMDITIQSNCPIMCEHPMKMSTHCILSKAFLPWAEGKFSIMSHVRDSFPSWRAHFLLTEHWHLRSVSFVFGFLAPWFHSKEKTMWRALLDSGPGHTVSHPSYCVFVFLIFKLHFTFPMGRVLRDPLPWKQGLRRKAVISNYTSGFYHPSNYWVRRMRGKTEGEGRERYR